MSSLPPILASAAAIVLCASAAAAAVDKPLTGRFIHITDIHPDQYYAPGSSVGQGCHKPSQAPDITLGVDPDDPRRAGRWGTGPSDCDSPLALMNLTFDWLEKNWADEVDFVIWTGDNARHDISRALPRTPDEIYDSNRMVADRMDSVFGSRGVKIVPSLGNNDIWPHNIMYPGPNRITESFLDIWSNYVPPEQTHVFERGAYFTSEVIPDRLAVISLNTLYWYDSNKAVDGCPFDGKEAGSEEMDWLEVQLSIFRARGMQVWLSGHVPPSPGNYFPDCWFRFGELTLRFQDTIIGSMFGHMNVDHWFMMESDALEQWRQNPDAFLGAGLGARDFSNASSFDKAAHADSLLESFVALSSSAAQPGTSMASSGFSEDDDGQVMESTSCDANLSILKSRTKSGTLSGDLLGACRRLPKRSKTDLAEYAIVNVGPSVIPTYFPSIRVFTYNATGEPFHQNQTMGLDLFALIPQGDDDLTEDELASGEDETDEHDDDVRQEAGDDADTELRRKKKKKKHGGRRKRPTHRPGSAWCRRRKHMFEPVCQAPKPRFVDADAPSRKNGFGTPLGYSQWFLPDVNSGKKAEPEYKLEYATYEPSVLVPGPEKRHLGSSLPPIPLHLLPQSLRSALLPVAAAEVKDEENTVDAADAVLAALKRYTPYRLKDLTIPSYLRFGRRLATDKELWKMFRRNMYVSTGAENDD